MDFEISAGCLVLMLQRSCQMSHRVSNARFSFQIQHCARPMEKDKLQQLPFASIPLTSNDNTGIQKCAAAVVVELRASCFIPIDQ